MNTQEHEHGQRGAVALVVALMLPLLVGVAAFAVDLAHVHGVRAELQNAADAAALRGARELSQTDPVTGQLRWSMAAQQAQAAIGLNRAEGRPLADGTVQTGFWNLRGQPAGLQSTAITPSAWDVPAVAVSLSKQGALNGGPVQTFWAKLWGRSGIDQSVQAVAALVSPGQMQPGALFPLAISQCLYDNYWNSAVYPPQPKINPATGQAWQFQIGSGYQTGPCAAGDWTAFLEDANDRLTIKKYMDTGNTTTLEIGQSIWIEPGAMAKLYGDAHDCSAAGSRVCEHVLVPVVSQTTNHALSPITAFACLHLLSGDQGGKYLSVQMSNRCSSPQGGGAGPSYGVPMPPSLVQ
jgi:Flp pilus assembly protein TadG